MALKRIYIYIYITERKNPMNNSILIKNSTSEEYRVNFVNAQDAGASELQQAARF